MSDRTNLPAGRQGEKRFICIMCPLGCSVTVKYDDKGSIVQILGASCKKGEAYVKEESTKPVRVLTSTVAIKGAAFSRLPVRTSGLIPKERIFDCMKEIEKMRVKAPVKLGDKIIENLLELGVDVVATRDLLT
jgi:CxxC motif-containing protein